MKKIISLFITAVICFALAPPAQADAGAVLTVSDDLDIRQNEPELNSDAFTELLFQNIGSSKYNREVWVRFDLSELGLSRELSFKSAKVGIYIGSNNSSGTIGITEPSTISLYSLSSNDYDAATVTYSTENRPIRMTKVASAEIAARTEFAEGYIYFDVTSYLNTLPLNSKVAFSFYPDAYKVSGTVYSKEKNGGVYAPTLSVEMEKSPYKNFVVTPKADATVDSQHPTYCRGSEEYLFASGSEQVLLTFPSFSFGDDNPNVTESANYKSVDITNYAATLFQNKKEINLCLLSDSLRINARESGENLPYLHLILNHDVLISARLYVCGDIGNLQFYEVAEEWGESSVCFQNMPAVGNVLPLGGTETQLDVTVEGYTDEQLANTYYMAKDDGRAYPEVSEIFDETQVASVSEIQSILNEAVHPYLVGTQSDFDRIVSLKETDPEIAAWYSAIEKKGDAYLTTAATAYNISSGALSTNVYGAAVTLAFLYRTQTNVVKRQAYAERCMYFMKAAASYPDWNPQKLLNIGEIGRGIAIGYDWLYDWMTEEQKTIIRNALISKCLNVMDGAPCLNTNNWNIVANGGTLLAALSVGADSPEISARLVRQCVLILPKSLRCFYPNGVFIEASGYFTYTMDYLGTALSSLYSACGTDWGLSSIQGISQCGYYPIYTRGHQDNQAIAYGDGDMQAVYSPTNFWLSKRFSNTDFGVYEKNGGSINEFSLIWYDPAFYEDASGLSHLPKDYFADGITPMTSMRSDWENENGLFIGLKGGFNQTSHGDLDIGTFYLGANGKCWTKELLGVDYHKSTAELPPYFRFSRYTYYAKSPQGHNTLVINQPSYYPDMSFGQELTAYCGLCDSKSGENESYAVLDMTAAYHREAAQALRGVKINREDGYVILTDKLELKKPSDVWWFMHTDAQIETYGDSAVLTLEGERLLVKLLSPNDSEFYVTGTAPLPRTPTVSAFDISAHMGGKKLALRLKNAKSEEIQIAFVPFSNDAVPQSPKYLPLDAWNDGLQAKKTILSTQASKQIVPSADGYTNEYFPTDTFSDLNYMDIKYTATSTYNREGYLRFDVNDALKNKKISYAALHLYASRNYCKPYQTETAGIYAVEANWEETSLTWNNRPVFGSHISDLKIGTNGENSMVDTYVSADVTDYVTEKIASGKMSFGLRMTSRRNANVSFYSKEETIYHPYLEIRYTQKNYMVYIGADEREVLAVLCKKTDGRLDTVKTYRLTGGSSQMLTLETEGEHELFVLDAETLKPCRYAVCEAD